MKGRSKRRQEESEEEEEGHEELADEVEEKVYNPVEKLAVRIIKRNNINKSIFRSKA